MRKITASARLSPVVASERIRPLADELGFESRVFDLADEAVAVKNLEGIAAVLHCAGPFSATSRPMLAACMRAGTHYLDITGEIAVLEAIHSRKQEIRNAGIVAVPAVGFDVVPTDCLAAMLKQRPSVRDPSQACVQAALRQAQSGTTKTMFEGLPEGGRIRKEGTIIRVPPAYKVEIIPFTETLSATAVTIPWGTCRPPTTRLGFRTSKSSQGCRKHRLGK
jgi:short subunit dehydrogenase-like uncharacterized protein